MDVSSVVVLSTCCWVQRVSGGRLFVISDVLFVSIDVAYSIHHFGSYNSHLFDGKGSTTCEELCGKISALVFFSQPMNCSMIVN